LSKRVPDVLSSPDVPLLELNSEAYGSVLIEGKKRNSPGFFKRVQHSKLLL
jgi:hypothetical protein